MNLWIDGQCLQTASRLRGIGRYVQEFIRALAESNSGVELWISFNASMPDAALAARDYVRQWIDPSAIHVWHGVTDNGEAISGYDKKRRLSEIAIAHHVACLNPDVALSASPFEGIGDAAVPIAPDYLDIPTASIFYDAIPHRLAADYLVTPEVKSYYYRRLGYFAKFDLNLCISEYSRTEANELSGNPACVNISAGASPEFIDLVQDGSPSDIYPPDSRFVLYVGAFDPRKNVHTVVDAFARLPDDLKFGLKFVLAGDQPADLIGKLKQRWTAARLPADNIVVLGHVSDRAIVQLNKRASLVIQPSLLEGFGLTALEAMLCGAPVIGSANGGLVELIANPDLLFNPRDPQNIADKIVRIFRDPEFTAQAVANGLQRAQQFTWKKTAAIAAAALCEIASRAGSHTPRSRNEIRSRTFNVTKNVRIAPDLVAECLARAEPPQNFAQRLLVDATSTIRIDHGTGIQRVTKQITRNLLRDDDCNCIVTYCDGDDGFFKVDAGAIFPTSVKKSESEKLQFLGADKILMLDSSWEFYRHQLPRLLAARLRGSEVVSCLYDTVPLRFEAMCNPAVPGVFVEWFKCALTFSTGFVCISRAVADELYAMLEGIHFPRRLNIGFWHLGADFSTAPAAAIAEPRAKERVSFLMVGTVEMRKGHRLVLEAFESLWRENFEAELVIVGKPGWGVDHLIAILRKHSERNRRLHWHENANDEELRRLYANADALIAASYTEGFGLPIVEARHFKKPIIASDIPVFREVTQGSRSARFFQAGSSAALESAIREFLRDFAEQHALLVEDTNWIDWQESARQLRKVVVEDNWYRVYEPVYRKAYVSYFDHGTTSTREPLEANGRRHNLELVEGPVPFGEGRQVQYVLRVTNLSDTVWSSMGTIDGLYGVFLTYRVLTANGRLLTHDLPKVPISFVLIPGDSHYIAVNVPLDQKTKQGSFVELEMFQEGIGPWGDALRLPI
jgi:glycosyltransferase involved in cell wall biosynthesis